MQNFISESNIEKENELFFKDLTDHVIKANELIELLFNTASNLMDLYLSLVSNKMNEIMKVLAMISKPDFNPNEISSANAALIRQYLNAFVKTEYEIHFFIVGTLYPSANRNSFFKSRFYTELSYHFFDKIMDCLDHEVHIHYATRAR